MRGVMLAEIEWKKLRRSQIGLIYLLAMVILWLPSVLNAELNFQMQDIGISPENSFMIQGYMGYAWFLFPACVVVSTVLLTQLERGDRGMLKMLSLPISPAALCLTKFMVLLALTGLCSLLSVPMYLLAAAAASRMTGYVFLLPAVRVARMAAKLWLSGIPMAGCFWLLAVWVETPAFSVGIGLASIVPSVLLINTKLWIFYPMAYPFHVLTEEYQKVAVNFSVAEANRTEWVIAAAGITAASVAVSCFGFGQKNRF